MKPRLTRAGLSLPSLLSWSLLLSTAPLHAQAAASPQSPQGSAGPQVRSTTNPGGGLRGAPTYGLATYGSSARGLSSRTEVVSHRPTLAEFLEWIGAEPTPAPGVGSPPPPPPAPGAGAAPRPVPRIGPGAAPAGGTESPDAQYRLRARLLTLRSGAVLQATSRRLDDGWQVQIDGAWQRLAGNEVVSTVLEGDVLAELRQRLRGRDDSDPGALLADADWMLERGLVREGLRALDVLLAGDPDDPDVLELLAASSEKLLAPGAGPADGTEALLALGARSSPGAQELIVQQLVPYGVRHRNELERRLLDEQQSPDAARSDFGALALRRLFPARATMRQEPAQGSP